ncbi:MAG TPA: hypothetical protein VG826_12915 [Pirellulales bacterium]|nr:hypothetical protein [Pirellulales bacterium]
MNKKEKRQATEAFLIESGWDADSAKEAATEAIDEGEPLLETLCFQKLAEFCLARIHDSSWVKNRAKEADSDEGDGVIKRLLDSGASADDLAHFARLMQRQCLSDLGSVLDGAGVWGAPELPYKEFRIFAVRELDSPDNCKPEAQIKELHESLGFSDWETEMKLSRDAAEASRRKREGK